MRLNALKQYNRNRWNLAFFDVKHLNNIMTGNYSGVRWMKYNDTTRWFADPFILDINQYTIEVLVEELSYESNKGRIAKLTINRDTLELEKMKILLTAIPIFHSQ